MMLRYAASWVEPVIGPDDQVVPRTIPSSPSSNGTGSAVCGFPEKKPHRSAAGSVVIDGRSGNAGDAAAVTVA